MCLHCARNFIWSVVSVVYFPQNLCEEVNYSLHLTDEYTEALRLFESEPMGLLLNLTLFQ